jgi:surfactin synthase thioesterase subunit
MLLEYEVCAIRFRGPRRPSSEAPLGALASAVAMAAAALEAVVDLPYAVLGHSLSSLTASEVSRKFRCPGLPPPLRLVVASPPGPEPATPFSSIHPLPQKEFIEQLALAHGPPPLLSGRKDAMVDGVGLNALAEQNLSETTVRTFAWNLFAARTARKDFSRATSGDSGEAVRRSSGC